jgi:very-short-patch-repair endonuclease
MAHDAERDAWLGSQRFLVLRFPNKMIAEAPYEVFEAILAAAKSR